MDREGGEHPFAPPDERGRNISTYKDAYTTPPTTHGEVPVVTTQPDFILRHSISNEELEALSDMKRGYLYEGQWTALGIFLAGFPQSAQAIYSAYLNKPLEPISIFDLGMITISGISLVVFFVIKTGILKNQEKADIICETIKSRPKVTVQGGGSGGN